MATQEFRIDPKNILDFALPDPRNQTAPIKLGVSLTIAKGQALGIKTSDHLGYPFNATATDGTQVFVGFNRTACSTDASGNVYFTTSAGTSAPFYLSLPDNYAGMCTGGVFDPGDLATSPTTGTPTAEVDTITPTNPTTGDIYSVSAPNGVSASFIVGGTQTPTATVTGLKNSWNSDPYLTALATASGTATLILTGVTKGRSLNLTASAVGTGTTALVITTPAVSATQAQVDTWTMAGTIATGDIYTATLTSGGGQTRSVSFTVGATTTATAVDAGLKSAWNSDPYLSNVATASGTTTFILTNTVPGNSQSVAITSSGAGTITKVSTSAAFGQSLSDIQLSRPAYILQPYGFWVVE